MEKDNNGDYAHHTLTHTFSKASVAFYNTTARHFLASCFFSDHPCPSTPRPSLFLLQSHGPRSFLNPSESLLASGLLHLLFPLPGMCFPKEPAVCPASLPHSSPPSGLPCSHTLPNTAIFHLLTLLTFLRGTGHYHILSH